MTAQTPKATMTLFTVWEARGCTVPQAPVRFARIARVDDGRHQSEYQRIAWSGYALSPGAALAAASACTR